MNTTGLRFYHGTSAHAAASILANGAHDPFEPLRARELVGEVWPVILAAAGSFPETARLFIQAGSKYYTSTSVALQNICDRNNHSTFSYGYFYVSLSFDKAARYAFRSRTGSELLLFIEEALKVIRMLDRNIFDRLSDSYCDLMTRLEASAHPVVLELTGIHVDRMFGENGARPNVRLVELAMEWRGSSHVAIEPSFRIASVTAADITAIYDMQALVGEDVPSIDALDGLRTSPRDWYHQNACSGIDVDA